MRPKEYGSNEVQAKRLTSYLCKHCWHMEAVRANGVGGFYQKSIFSEVNPAGNTASQKVVALT